MANTIEETLDELTIKNRAYQMLYALGDTSWEVRTLTMGEARSLVAIAQDLWMGRCETALDIQLLQNMSRGCLEYVGSLAWEAD